MNPIIAPIIQGSNGADVINLQQALLHLLRRAALLANDPDLRAELAELISTEQIDMFFGEGTRQTVATFQDEQGLRADEPGSIDRVTAEAINAHLEALGLLVQSTSRGEALAVTGHVHDDNGSPVREGTIIAYHESERGSIRLGKDALDVEGNYVIRYDALPDIESINLRVSLIDAAGSSVVSSDVTRGAARLERIDLVFLMVLPDLIYEVEGTVSSTTRTGIAGLRVIVVERRVGEDVTLVSAETDRLGHYEASFDVDRARVDKHDFPDLQAQVFQGDDLMATSGIVYDARGHVRLDVLLPRGTDALESEHEILLSALSVAYSGNLRDLEETSARRDITYLANKSGWDARAVAMAALADQFSQHHAPNTDRAIAAPLFYALFRAGVPANEDALYAMNPATAERVWKQSLNSGLVPKSLAADVPAALEVFQEISAARALDARVVSGTSSLKELLIPVLKDVAQQQLFAEMRVRHGRDRAAFWSEAEGAFGPDVTKRLQLDGKLGFLTLNNAPLIAKLHESEAQAPLDSTLNLAQRGYYQAEKWQGLGIDTVPDSIAGETDTVRLTRYHELLAAQIRISYPTAVTAEMVRSKEIPLKVADLERESIYSFLSDNQGAFEIGMQPVEQFVVRNRLGDQIAKSTITEVTRLQRVRQITPTDLAMNVLLGDGLDSATSVLRYDETEFVTAYQDRIGGETAALLTYRKARQVYSAVLNLATSFVANQHGPALGNDPRSLVVDGQSTIAVAPNAGDVIAMPTLEQLLGSMDFCECDHCRSILSPAAYLVDLLLFADRPITDLENPLTVLLERRPDLEYLPLTCENTNIPMPYIDVVNETLEYFVTNQLSLDEFKGHDNDESVSGEELLANPRFVDSTAYTVLEGASFPPPLPFHRSLESLRRYFLSFETPLADVMSILRVNDDLERATPAGYGWRDILMEEIGCSRAEYQLLTERTVTLTKLYGFPVGTTDPQVRQQLTNAKAFTRRVGISIQELVDVLKARFINPGGALLTRVERLHVPATALKRLKDGALTDQQFEALLPPGLDPAAYGGSIPAWVKSDTNYRQIMKLITLVDALDSDDPSSFDTTELRYFDPADPPLNLTTVDYVRLARFLRLWRKLGWSIDHIDAVITALYPPNLMPDGSSEAADLQRLDDGFLILLPRIGRLLQVMLKLELKPNNDLLRTLAIWSPISTYGPTSLYREMFLAPGRLTGDATFADNGFGQFLTTAGPKVAAHGEALRAAFSLTTDELAAIKTTLGYGDATDLTLDTISAIFRRGWLARELKLSVRELLLLIDMTGIDPFASLDPVDPVILRFIDLIQKLKESPLKPTEALYLLWNKDLSGRSAPTTADIIGLARTLRIAFEGVESAFAVQDDPTGDVTRSRIGLVYGRDASDFVFGLVGRSVSDNVPYDHPLSEFGADLIAAGGSGLAYDDFRKQMLFAGMMPASIRDAIHTAADASADFDSVSERDTFKTAVTGLFDINQSRVTAFFTRFPELRIPVLTFISSADPLELRYRTLLTTLTASLVQRRRWQAALETTSATTGFEPALTRTLLQNSSVLRAASGLANTTALDDLVMVGSVGFSATYFWRSTASGIIDQRTVSVGIPDFSATGTRRLPTNGAAVGQPISMILRGFLDAPESDDYTIRIDAEIGATVTLSIGDTNIALDTNGSIWTNQSRISLTAGTLTPVVLTIENIRARLSVQWATSVRGLEVIPARFGYGSTIVDALSETWTRFTRAATLAIGLECTANEFAFLATTPASNIDGAGWLNALTTEGTPAAATATILGNVLTGLLDFSMLKAAFSPDDERLLDVMRNPAALLPNGDNQLQTVTGWNGVSLDAVLTRFGLNRANLSTIGVFNRVDQVFQLLASSGLPAATLISATTNEPTAVTVRDLQSALRATYASADWLAVLKPINDDLRGLQRNALVAYILQKMSEVPATAHIDTPDRLFEYFLMDVQMEPCMETSRIRHALSAVQLFIERCLMNLEPRVAPTSIRGKQWEWMKRYRVWEANRKVFLWPENWLEEELRDNVSYQFKETMSTLLQSDITEESAAVALGNYLVKLEEIAKLEPVAIHLVERDPGVADDVAHVIGRTAGGQRKYFYRQRGGGSWTPWEPIKLDIEDNPVAPVIWKNRLFLFWLRILKETPVDSSVMPTTAKVNGQLATMTMDTVLDNSSSMAKTTMKVQIKAVLCWSEFYNGKWQDPKTSDLARPTHVQSVSSIGEAGFDRSWLTFNPVEIDGVLYLSFASTWFAFYNTHSLPVRKEDADPDFYPYLEPQFGRGISWDTSMAMEYWGDDPVHGDISEFRSVLQAKIPFKIIEPQQAINNQWLAPFFLEDSRHVFWVRTAANPVSIEEWNPYGVVGPEVVPGIFIPDPVIPEKVIIPPRLYYVIPDEFEIPDLVGPIISPERGGDVLKQVTQFVTEDARIEVGLGMRGTVLFGDQEIGPSGPAFRTSSQG